jgi:hypothetical protein
MASNLPVRVSNGLPPREWVPGESKFGFFLGTIVVYMVSAFVGLALDHAVVPVTPQEGLLALLAQLGILCAVGVPASILYFLSVPCPENILLAPEGLMIVWGLRQKAYRWTEIRLWRNQAYLFGEETSWLRKSIWPGHIRLSPHQRARIMAWRKAYSVA